MYFHEKVTSTFKAMDFSFKSSTGMSNKPCQNLGKITVKKQCISFIGQNVTNQMDYFVK